MTAHRTNRCTRAAIACFASSFLELNGATTARPRELRRYALICNQNNLGGDVFISRFRPDIVRSRVARLDARLDSLFLKLLY